jgi:alpha-beta hydrolase superfamily lysophospholipase
LAANYVESPIKVQGVSLHSAIPNPAREIVFAGDNVRLAGQMDYPTTPMPLNGYPVMVILHHAGGNTRSDYAHYTATALESGYAVFRWDKRGTGRSGASGLGSSAMDAVKAYGIALKQPAIDPTQAVILAQGEGTLLLSETFEAFVAISQPFGVLLIGSLLDQKQILSIKARIQVIIGANDWISWQAYGKAPCDAHNAAYKYGARFSVAHHANRLLIDTRKPHEQRFHIGAKQIIKEWLAILDSSSTSRQS